MTQVLPRLCCCISEALYLCPLVPLYCLADLLLMRDCFPTLEVPTAFSFRKIQRIKIIFCDARQRARVSGKSWSTSDGGKGDKK